MNSQKQRKHRKRRKKTNQSAHLKKKNTQRQRRNNIQRFSKQKKLRKRKRLKGFLIEGSLSILITMVLLWGVSFFFCSPIRVGEYGMMPTLSEGDWVYSSRAAEIKRFSLVYFKSPDGKGRMIRRVIGLPGESVSYKEDQLYINLQEKSERFIAVEIADAADAETVYTEDFSTKSLFQEEQIPKGKYLLLGDNREYSTDSRYYGLIDRENIIGVVKGRLLPLTEMTRF